MADASPVTVAALAEVAAGAFTGEAADLGANRTAGKFRVRITACTAAFKLRIETSDDGLTGWRVLPGGPGSNVLVNVSAPDQRLLALDGLDRYVRVAGDAGADTTFEVSGEAHQLYADRGDLTLKMSSSLIAQLEKVEPGAVARSLIAASADMESALAVQHPMPLTTVPEIVRDKTADLAAYRAMGRLLIAVTGGACSSPSDQAIALANDGEKKAQLWLVEARKRIVLPFGAVPAPTSPFKTSSGNPDAPDCFPKKFSDGWGIF